MKAIAYMRRSQDSGTGVSEEIQDDRVREVVQAAGGKIVEWLPADLDKSSWTLERPSFQRALEVLAAGKADTLVVSKLNRLTRRRKHWEEILDLAEGQGWRVISAEFPDLDLHCTVGRMVAGIVIDISEMEYRERRQNYDDARGNAVVRHGVHGGTNPPKGYQWTQRLDENGQPKFDREGRPMRGPLELSEDAPRVNAAFGAFAEGASWTKVTEIAGMRSQGATYAMLSNPVYTGDARSGDFVKEGAHPAIVDKVLFARVQRKLAVRRRDFSYRVAGQKRVGAVLGGGIMGCGHCGYGLVKDGKRYKCVKHGCKKISVGAEAAEQYLLLQALAWHATLNPMHIAELDAAALPVFEEAVETAGAEVAEVERMHEAGELTPSAYAKALTVAQQALALAETALAEAEASRGWLGLDTEVVQRKLLDGSAVRDIAGARDFIKQMLRATVKPVGKGTHMPVSGRMEIEFLTPRPPEVQDALDAAMLTEVGA
jgi:DNA invertase Pin-like site-specific DNA recombinase